MVQTLRTGKRHWKTAAAWQPTANSRKASQQVNESCSHGDADLASRSVKPSDPHRPLADNVASDQAGLEGAASGVELLGSAGCATEVLIDVDDERGDEGEEDAKASHDATATSQQINY